MAGAQDASIFELGLPRRGANFRPLSPLDFLAWCEDVFPARTGVIYGQTRYTYGELGARCRRLASALRRLGVGKGDTVAVMCPNTPPCSRPTTASPCWARSWTRSTPGPTPPRS